jgi:hypothetical protein
MSLFLRVVNPRFSFLSAGHRAGGPAKFVNGKLAPKNNSLNEVKKKQKTYRFNPLPEQRLPYCCT